MYFHKGYEFVEELSVWSDLNYTIHRVAAKLGKGRLYKYMRLMETNTQIFHSGFHALNVSG